MIKIFSIFLSIFISLIAFADESKLREIMEKTYPDLTIKSINKTDYNDLYEVFIGSQIVYTNDNFDFLIDGRVVDPKTKTDLTGLRLEELTRINFSDLPLSDAIKVVKGDGKRKIAIFSDVDCPFCKRLEKKELSNIDNITIYTFLYPLDTHPEAEEKSKKIWCAKNRAEAWSEYILNDTLPKNSGDCKTPINKIIELGKNLGISSTPTIILSSGTKILGAVSHKQL